MSHFRKLLALLLALAWLPATLHCFAEEMGIATASTHVCSLPDAGGEPLEPSHHAECQACVTFDRALVKAQLVTISLEVPVVRVDALTAALLAQLKRRVAEYPRSWEESPPPFAERFSRTVSLLI